MVQQQAIWYYDAGHGEQGPVTALDLRRLAEAGQLLPEHVVRKEGMAEWVPASQVAGLLPSGPPVAAPARPAASPAAEGGPPLGAAPAPQRARPAEEHEADGIPQIDTGDHGGVGSWVSRMRYGATATQPLQAYGQILGQPLLLVGLILVIFARGCDNLGVRMAAADKARSDLTQNRFGDEWEAKRLPLEEELDQLRDKEKPTSKDRERRQEINEELSDLQDAERKERREKQRGEWRDLRIAARDASSYNRMWGMWREYGFIIGSVLLSVGLLACGFSGSGAERWICLILLAIILFSVYVGGFAWIPSVLNSISVAGPALR